VAITPQDRITVEVSKDGNEFFDAAAMFPPMESGSNKYGIDVEPVDAVNNQIDVRFGGNGANGSEAWSAYTAWFWRVRVTRANLSAGFGSATITTSGLTRAPIACASYASASQTGLSSGVLTKVQLNVEELDNNSFFDNVTNYRATPNVAGWYQVSWSMRAASTTASSVRNMGTMLYKNGSGFKEGTQISHPATAYADSGISNGSALVYANGTTDYFELWGFVITTSGTWYIIGGQSITYFSMVKVSD
jgi:hypothetical protein